MSSRNQFKKRTTEYHRNEIGMESPSENRVLENGSSPIRAPIRRYERDLRKPSNQKYSPYTNNRRSTGNYQSRYYHVKDHQRSNYDQYATNYRSNLDKGSFRERRNSQHGPRDRITKQHDRKRSISNKDSFKVKANNHHIPDERFGRKTPTPPTSFRDTLYQHSPHTPGSSKWGSKRLRDGEHIEANAMEEPATQKTRNLPSPTPASSKRGSKRLRDGEHIEANAMEEPATQKTRNLPSPTVKKFPSASKPPLPVKRGLANDMVKKERRNKRNLDIGRETPIVMTKRMSTMMWLWEKKWRWEDDTSVSKPFPAKSLLSEVFCGSNPPSHNSREFVLESFLRLENCSERTVDDEDWMIQASESLLEDIDKEMDELDSVRRKLLLQLNLSSMARSLWELAQSNSAPSFT